MGETLTGAVHNKRHVQKNGQGREGEYEGPDVRQMTMIEQEPIWKHHFSERSRRKKRGSQRIDGSFVPATWAFEENNPGSA